MKYIKLTRWSEIFAYAGLVSIGCIIGTTEHYNWWEYVLWTILFFLLAAVLDLKGK